MTSEGIGARRRPGAVFLRLWLLMTFSYVILTLVYDLVGPGYVDLRESSLLKLLVVPLGQAVVFWLVTRARARGDA